MKRLYSLVLLVILWLTNQTMAQTSDCDNTAGGQFTVNSSCINTAFNSTNNTDYWNSASGCSASDYDDAWGWFTATSTSTTITYTPSSGDAILTLFSATCATNMASVACADNSVSGAETITYATTVGATYHIRIQNYNSNNNMNGDICVYSSSVSAGCTPNTTIASIPYTQTGLTTSGAGDDFSSTDACGSSYMNGDDYVFTYTPSSNECINITLTNTSTWVGLFVTDACPSAAGAVCVASGTSSSGNPSVSGVNLTGGITYFFTVSTYPSPQSTPFDISIIACPPPPANDECAGAISLTVNSDASCGTTTAGTIASSTGSSQSTAACGGTEDDDVWFSFVATNTTHYIDLLNVTGSTTDLYHSVWTGTCPSLTLVTGSCSDPNSSSPTGLTIGQTYYVRVYSWTSTTGQNTSFNICIGSPPPPSCYSVGSITYSPDAFAGTLITFPDDQFSAILNIGFSFCFYGSSYTQLVVSSNGFISFNTGNASGYSTYSTVPIPNTTPASILNSIMGPWQDIDPSVGTGSDIRYQTLGTSPNRRFVVSFIDIPMYSSSCNSMLFTGQIKIYETSNDIDICIQNKPLCTSWNSGNAVEGIHDPTGTEATVVTGRNNTNWTATNDAQRFTSGCGPCSYVLPIELLSFNADYSGEKVELNWETASEINNDFFTIEKSKDGTNFKKVATVKGAGNSNRKLKYKKTDENPFIGTSYYRLKQTDYDGKHDYSDIIAVSNENNPRGNLTVMPNPFTDKVDLVFNSAESEQCILSIYDITGHIVLSKTIKTTEGNNQVNLDLSEFEKGIYFLTLSTNYKVLKIKLIKD